MAELTLSASDIASALKKNLEGFTPSLEGRTVGHVAEVGDGIARVSGLPDCAVNELLEFEDGTVGLAMNLDEETIGAVVLGSVDGIDEDQIVRATGRILSVPVGDAVLGRVVDALGNPIDGKGDSLLGLKENIIIGKLIPAGTGMMRYRDFDVEAPEYVPMTFYSTDADEDPAAYLSNIHGTYSSDATEVVEG